MVFSYMQNWGAAVNTFLEGCHRGLSPREGFHRRLINETIFSLVVLYILIMAARVAINQMGRNHNPYSWWTNLDEGRGMKS